MNRLQVLVATMHQKDLSIVEKMNIRCSAVVANQADRNEILVDGDLKMITTTTRGVGLNRNIALLASDGDILLFADDDVVYNDDMPQAVTVAFQENPQADVLIFGLDMVRNGSVYEKRHLKKRRLFVFNAMRFGTCRIAIRRQSLLQANIFFHQKFGGGCPFYSGEDSLFLKACFDRGLKVYAHEYVLGTCDKDTSTWFVGFNEKFFYDKGVLMRCMFPRLPYLMALYFAIRFKKPADIKVGQRIRLMLEGVRYGKSMRLYQNEV